MKFSQTQQQPDVVIAVILAFLLLSSFCLCAQFDSKVSGGTSATDNEFPHMVSIQYFSSPTATGIHYCGGTLISPKHVVTASHCEIGLTMDKIRIVMGSSSNVCSSNLAASQKCIMRGVTRFTKHPNYDSSTIKNDIAIIELDQPVPLDGWRVTSAVVEGSTIPTNTQVYIAGWGRTTSSSSVTNLQKAQVPVSPASVCNAKNLGMTTPQQICGGNGNGIDTCGGDSGGPLFRKVVPQSGLPIFVLAGVVSYGPPGCGGSNVGVYTNATHYLDFIRSQVSTGTQYTVATLAYGAQQPSQPTPQPSPTPVTPQPTPKPSQQSCKCKCYCKKLQALREGKLRGNLWMTSSSASSKPQQDENKAVEVQTECSTNSKCETHALNSSASQVGTKVALIFSLLAIAFVFW
ncbi:hypothetical protein FDP41_009595 [Naegleria fowleri]|uniref:Peptidase S1 domain-containing protein n=1 Tax=Naegleria fowleri TaxID=5763 RepID=A0A6A5BFQ7_NAEFO|nr:uncharacterized protein FDP41_009595 [Naegleria fowleri]KAF0971899.1 hypothetical protein FDP41_009595 [Naegleria fowleri]CAG4713013.1 unnamed protein product [Naegleria fowleri]